MLNDVHITRAHARLSSLLSIIYNRHHARIRAE